MTTARPEQLALHRPAAATVLERLPESIQPRTVADRRRMASKLTAALAAGWTPELIQLQVDGGLTGGTVRHPAALLDHLLDRPPVWQLQQPAPEPPARRELPRFVPEPAPDVDEELKARSIEQARRGLAAVKSGGV